MIKLGKSSALQFCASVDMNQSGEDRISRISLIDPSGDITQNQITFETFARIVALKIFDSNEEGGLMIPLTSISLEDGMTLELEKFETESHDNHHYKLFLKVSHVSDNTPKRLKQRNRELEQRNLYLSREVKELLSLVEKIEQIKESFRIPFDAIKDLVISFDSNANVIIINEACTEWFGQTPKDMVRKKYKTILKQNIFEKVKEVIALKEARTIEESIGNKMFQITFMPMINRKSGDVEVVMLAQDITRQKKEEQARLEKGRDEGVAIMSGTIRHILNSSLHAILGFSQLALSTYDWPRETMVKYLRLIERTAQRMKREINKLADQKQFKPTKYVNVPGAENCKQIQEIKDEPDA